MLVENELKKLQTFDSSYFRGKIHLNYLVFQPSQRYFKVNSNTERISLWKSKGLSNEIIKPVTTSDNTLYPKINYIGNKKGVKLVGSCLKQDKFTFTHYKRVNIYIVYKTSVLTRRYDDYPALENCLFGAVRLTKNADTDTYKFGIGIGFDRRGTFPYTGGGFGCNVIFFGVDMSSSVHIDNKTKYFLILSEGSTQELDITTLTAEKIMINFTVARKKFCWGLHYNGTNSYLFVKCTEIIKYKAKNSDILTTPLYLGNVSNGFFCR